MIKKILASTLLVSLLLLSACSSTNQQEAISNEVNFDQESTQPQYVEYSPATLEAALGKRPFVLFFHAQWCIICKSVEENVKADLANFPEQTLFMQADYDKDTDLKKEYGVGYQSTLLFFNAEGEIVEEIIGPDNETIIEYINNSKQ